MINYFLIFKEERIRVVDFIGGMRSSYKEYSKLGHKVKNGTLKFKEYSIVTEKNRTGR
jgi:hypothetical protein